MILCVTKGEVVRKFENFAGVICGWSIMRLWGLFSEKLNYPTAMLLLRKFSADMVARL